MLDDPELSLQFFNEEIRNSRIRDETILQTEQQIEELEFEFEPHSLQLKSRAAANFCEWV